jgi:hypothetical protein
MVRRRAVRGLLWFGLAGVGLLTVAAALSSPHWLHAFVEQRASVMLARPVAIGHLHFRPGDPLVASAENVVIGNPQGFPP